MFEFAKEIYFDDKALGNKRTRDISNKRLLKSPAIMARSLRNQNQQWIYEIFVFQS